MRTTLAVLSLCCISQVNAYDLPQKPVKSYVCDRCDTLSRDTLQDRWNITSDGLNKAGSTIQKSYSYTQRVTAKEVEQGVRLPIHSSGAIVRITPLQSKPIPALELKNASAPFMSLKEASSLYSQDEAIDESLRIGSHQTMLQIKPELGKGSFILKSKTTQANTDNDIYLIHVFEKYSLIYLQIEPSALQYQYGDEFKATISLKDNETNYPLSDINASLIGPGKQVIPLQISELKHNQFEAKGVIFSEVNTHGENWYVEVNVINHSDDSDITYRSARAAFSYSIPSASLISIRKVSSNPLTLTALVDVATASRYALQSVLYHTNANGQTVPVEITQSGQWLKPGKQSITLSFDNSAHLAEDQLSIGYLHLTDYGQLKTVYQYDPSIKLSQLLD